MILYLEQRMGERLINQEFVFSAESVPHAGHSERNEDSIVYGNDYIVVCDGVGGLPEGSKASWEAVRVLQDTLARIPFHESVGYAEYTLQKGFQKAALEVANECKGATTAAVVKVLQDGDGLVALFANRGDTRSYVFQNGILWQVSDDGLRLNTHRRRKLEEAGLDPFQMQAHLDRVKTVQDYNGLSEIEREFFDKRHKVDEVLGRQHYLPYQINAHCVPIEKGDIILICTDGVHDNLTFEEMQELLGDNTDASNLASRFVQEAKTVSTRSRKEIVRAKPDDMSAVLLRVI